MLSREIAKRAVKFAASRLTGYSEITAMALSDISCLMLLRAMTVMSGHKFKQLNVSGLCSKNINRTGDASADFARGLFHGRRRLYTRHVA